MRAMEEFDLDLIEQPVPRRDLLGMRDFTRALDTPVLADQSIFSVRDAADLIRADAADAFMVKIYVLGGLYRCKQLLGILEAMHKANYIEGGSETGIATAATLHLAASVAKVDYYGVLNGPMLREDDLIVEPLQYDDGCWVLPEKPGLGVELDEKQLKGRLVK